MTVCTSTLIIRLLIEELRLQQSEAAMNSAAGSFTGFRKSCPAPRASDAISEKARVRRTVRRGVRAQQQQQQAASELEPGWDKLSSDDFDTWMDNGGPPTPLLVRPLLLLAIHVCAERPIPMQPA